VPSRNLNFPGGVSWLEKRVDLEMAECGADSLFGLIRRKQSFDTGTVYITVPFDCPESIVLQELHSQPFYEDHSVDYNPQLLREVYMVEATNSAFRSLVEVSDWWILTQEGRQPTGYEDQRLSRPPEFEVRGVHYRFINRQFDEETTWDVLNDPVPRFRVLARPPVKATFDQGMLEEMADQVECIALSIFDYCGYLVWFPHRT